MDTNKVSNLFRICLSHDRQINHYVFCNILHDQKIGPHDIHQSKLEIPFAVIKDYPGTPMATVNQVRQRRHCECFGTADPENIEKWSSFNFYHTPPLGEVYDHTESPLKLNQTFKTYTL